MTTADKEDSCCVIEDSVTELTPPPSLTPTLDFFRFFNFDTNRSKSSLEGVVSSKSRDDDDNIAESVGGKDASAEEEEEALAEEDEKASAEDEKGELSSWAAEAELTSVDCTRFKREKLSALIHQYKGFW